MTSNEPAHNQASHGVKTISWVDFEDICSALAHGIQEYDPDAIVGIARGGLYPAAMIAHLLGKRIIPLSASKQVKDGTHQKTVLLARPNEELTGQKILVVDEICVTGESLLLATKELEALGAKEVRRAVMYSHTEHQGIPDYIGIITDEFIINPWDKYVLSDGQLQPSDEYTQELQRRGLDVDDYIQPQGDRESRLAKQS